MKNIEKDTIDLKEIAKTVWNKRKTFYIVLPIVFILSCIWIFPQPRYYTAEVKLAPENGGTNITSDGLSSIASSFGINIGNIASPDAIYPTLYPDLIYSTDFIVKLFDIQITTYDGKVSCNYYTYLNKHQKKNPITEPYNKLKRYITNLFTYQEQNHSGQARINPFNLTKRENDIKEIVMEKISCSVDKKTDVISIRVKDQDRKVCAILADSVRERLQSFIIDYRTKKARQDVEYYQHLSDSAKTEYDKANAQCAAFFDSHKNVVLESTILQGEKLKNVLSLKTNTYNTLCTQLSLAKAKVQERTPSFTILQSPTIPIKPTGPKRLLFVLGMLIITAIGIAIYSSKSLLFK